MSFTNLLKAAVVFLIAGLCALRICPCTCKNCPNKQPIPNVKPSPKDEPKCPDGPWDPHGKLTVGGPTSPSGKEVECDLPLSQRTKNVGGRYGVYLCVFHPNLHAVPSQHSTDLARRQ